MPDPILHRARRAAFILLRGGPEPKPEVQASFAPLTEADLAQVRAFFPMPKFFLMGYARSGTTLLARLIRVHPQVHCNWQAHFFSREQGLNSLVASPEAAHWLRRSANRWNGGRDLSTLVMRVAADFMMERDARRVGKSVVGDKSPNSLIHGDAVRSMHAIYPDAAVIYILRDGRDVAVSERFRSFVEERDLTSEDRQIRTALRADPARFRDGTDSMFTESFFRQYARRWATDLAEVPAEGLGLYGRRFTSLRYEDLLLRPFEEMSRLWQFLGVEVDPALAEAVTAEMSANPDEVWQEERDSTLASFLPRGQTGNWRSLFTERDRKLFKEVAGETLVKWGYEKDLGW
jgi:sulfotransferase family protein